MTSEAASSSFSETQMNRGTVLVEMGHVGTVDYDPASGERQAIGTSALNGCIGVTALFRGEHPESAVAMLSHFPPSGDTNQSAMNIAPSVAAQQAQGRKPDSVVIMAPGQWAKDETTGYWVEKPYATVEPDIQGYKQALAAAGVADVKVMGYIPDDLALRGMAPDPNTGTMLAEFYKGSDNVPQLRVFVEGHAVPTPVK